MSLGTTPEVEDLYSSSARLCDDALADNSIFKLLYRFGDEIFPDEFFCDLYDNLGRASIPPRILATVMVLQRLHGLSDREAANAFTFDMRYKYACGGLGYEYPGFVHSVLVDFRSRLAGSDSPTRIFDAVLEVVSRAKLIKETRVLDSTPLYDAVATMDTVTLLRRGIRGVYEKSVAKESAYKGVVSQLIEVDRHLPSAKPIINWDDPKERDDLINGIAKDATTILDYFESKPTHSELGQALVFLSAIMGQDIEVLADRYVISKHVAKDRIISSVDTDARHGRKSSKSRFDGYKAHISVDPESEIITSAKVTPGNVHDSSVALDLIDEDAKAVYGDNAYGTGELVNQFEQRSIEAHIKAKFPKRIDGLIPKSDFVIDLDKQSVTCPAGITIGIRPKRTRDGGRAPFGKNCKNCRLVSQCTKSKSGRTIQIGPFEQQLQQARLRFADPAFRQDYRETRPKVERKLAHLTRRLHGGRRARVRGITKVTADFLLLVAAQNLARIAKLGVSPPKILNIAPI